MDSAAAPAGTRVVASQRRLFPLILMDVLNLSSSDPNLAEILAWNDDGTSFRVLSRQGLEEIVMPQYFGLPSSKSGRASSSIKYASFTRKLNRWGFRRITAKGPDLGNFHHYQFRRDEPELIALMECTKHRYGTTDTAADASFGTTFTTSAASVVDSSIGGTAAASSLISAWGSIYPGTGTYGAPGYIHTNGLPTYTSTSEGALMHLSSQVAHPATPNPNYYTKLEIMALARRDRAIVQYRNAAGASLPHQSKQEEGKKEDEDQQEQQKKESSSDNADANRKTEEVQGDGTNPEDLQETKTGGDAELVSKSAPPPSERKE